MDLLTSTLLAYLLTFVEIGLYWTDAEEKISPHVLWDTVYIMFTCLFVLLRVTVNEDEYVCLLIDWRHMLSTLSQRLPVVSFTFIMSFHCFQCMFCTSLLYVLCIINQLVQKYQYYRYRPGTRKQIFLYSIHTERTKL